MSRPTAITMSADILEEARTRLEAVATTVLSRADPALDGTPFFILDSERLVRDVPDGSHAAVAVPLVAIAPVADGPNAVVARLLAGDAAEALVEAALEALAPRGGPWATARRTAAIRVSLTRPRLRRVCAVAATVITFRVPQTH